MTHDISYNSQRNNFNFDGSFSAYSQCFSTCAWMLMSYYSLQIDALDDKALSKYVDDVETSVGSVPGLAEKLKQKDASIKGYSSTYWEVQRVGISMWLNNIGVKGKAVCDLNSSYENMKKLVESKPVIIGTNKMGSLPGGHIILGVGKDDIHIVSHDPFGNANKNYQDSNGRYAYYEDDFLKKYFVGRILYWSIL